MQVEAEAAPAAATGQARPWIAVLLALLFPPLAMLYVARWRWSLAYLLALLGIAGIIFFYGDPRQVLANLLATLLAITAMVHAYRLAKRYSGQARPAYSRWYGVLACAVGLFSLVFVVRALVLEPFRVPAGSMLPGL